MAYFRLMKLRTNTFAFILGFLSFSVFAQKSDTLYLDSEKVPTEKSTASFFKVLTYDKKGKKVENEKFLTIEGSVLEETNFKKGKRDGYYLKKDLKLKTETIGQFEKDQKVGVWKTNSINGTNLFYDVYTDKGVLEGRYSEQVKSDEIFEYVEEQTEDKKHPSYPGGWPAWNSYLESNLNRPENIDTRTSGPVLMNFVVLADGTIKDITLQKSSGFQEVDEEALRVLRESGKWVPGQINSLPVSMQMKLALRLIIQSR